jgi:hypothetical protein
MIIDDLSKLPASFKNGYRGILLIHRNKDGAKGNAQRKSFKKISSSLEQWEKIVLEFAHMQKTSHPEFRIYSSVNSRNMQKAIHEFKRRQLEFDYGNNQELDEFYRDIDNRFFSCLMNPNCKMESNFLIDCDTEADYQKAKCLIPNDLWILDYKTKNGRHLITKPFNPNEIKVEIKKDDLINIG